MLLVMSPKEAGSQGLQVILLRNLLNKLEMILQMNMTYLQKLIYVATLSHDIPVAFASNTLYVLERNGCGNKEVYEKVLFPVLRKKIDNLHAEGVS